MKGDDGRNGGEGQDAGSEGVDADRPSWRGALARLLEGEGLSPGESQTLAVALAEPGNRREAERWLSLEANLRALGDEKRGFDPILSREKLLARAALHERAHDVEQRVARKRLVRRVIAATGAVAAAAAAIGIWQTGILRAPDATLAGDVRLERGGQPISSGGGARRGDRITGGPAGGRVQVGDCCLLDLTAGADLVVLGSPGKEEVRLTAGELRSIVQPNRGGFRIQTPLGPIEVLGTEFVTRIGRQVTSAGSKITVTVEVTEGRVRCDLAGEGRVLADGERHTFGMPAPSRTDGRVLSAGGEAAVIKTGNEAFTIEPTSSQASWDISLLVPGDPVVVTWIERDGQKLVTDVTGFTVGTVVRVEPNRMTIAPVHGGPDRSFGAAWIGAEPKRGGHLDERMLALIARQSPGTLVRVTWNLAEGTRLIDIAPVRR